MIEDLSGVTGQLIRVALDAAVARHQVIANNIANVDTPGYVPKRLSFEDQLSRFATQMSGSAGDSALKGELDSIAAMLNDGSLVRASAEHEGIELDREMVRLTENVLRYQALLEAASKRGAVMRLAISGGRQ